MINTAKIEGIIEEFVKGTDLFLVEIKSTPGNEIEVIIDSDSAISIDQCIELSKTIESNFNREEEDFELTVMSSGIGQPLKLPRQYKKMLGKSVEIVMKDGMKYTGILQQAEADKLTLFWQEKQLVEGKKRKQLVDIKKELLLDEIKTTSQQLSFK